MKALAKQKDTSSTSSIASRQPVEKGTSQVIERLRDNESQALARLISSSDVVRSSCPPTGSATQSITPLQPAGNAPVRDSKPGRHSETAALSRLIEKSSIQGRYSLSKPDDKFEQQADKQADRVVKAAPESAGEKTDSQSKIAAKSLAKSLAKPLAKPPVKQVSPLIQRQSGVDEKEEEEKKEIQGKLFLLRQVKEEPRGKATVQTEEEESVQTKPQKRGKEKGGIKFVVNVNEPEEEAKEELQSKPDRTKSMLRKISAFLSPSAESSRTQRDLGSSFETSLNLSKGGGSPLPEGTQTFMGSRFDADFSGVRLHTDSSAALMSEQIGAQAFTHGNDIYFNVGKYDPGTSEGRHLLAHELTHTIQQGASVQQKTAKEGVGKTSSLTPAPKIQRSWLGDAWDSVSGAVSGAVESVMESLEAGLNWIKGQFHDFVLAIPGYRLLTVVLGEDPVSGAAVARSGINFIEAGLDIIPFGRLLRRKLEETGALEEAAAWLDNQMAGMDLSLTTILADISAFWNSLSLSDIGDPAGVLNRAANIIRRPIGQIVTFAGNVATEFLRIVKNYVISELAAFVRDNTRGYPLLAVILGQDPITEEAVERNGMNLIRGFMLLSADGEEQLRQMEETGSLQRAADWIDGAVARLDLSWATIRNIFSQAWNLISIENLMRPMETFRQLVTLFAAPVGRIIRFLIEVGLKILEFIKKALLSRLSAFARGTRGYPLLTVILGKDPFTEEAVERNPENIIHGFMSLMEGGEEQFQQMKESGAIARTTAWIEGAVARLGVTWEFIVGLFTAAWNSFSLQDLAAPLAAFARILRLFAEPVRRLLAFIWEVIKKVIEILLVIMKFPVDLVSNIITKAMQAIEDIKRDPVGFIKNLLRAIKAGFSKFFDNILTHLINGLTGWLFSELAAAGISPPRDLSLRSIFGFVMDVLGITMERIWHKLGEKIGHERVARIRGMIDRLTGIWTFVKDVMTRGPIAIWEYIVEKVSNLWNMVLEHVRNWVVTRIIQRVTAKLLSMLDPTGIMAVVNSVIALYNAIESFIRYLRQMLEIVNSFVEGVAEIARGSVTRAAEFLENSLARAMPVAIGFLANQVGLGGLGRRIGEMIGAVREKVDQALDWLIDKAVRAGTAFLNMARGGLEAVRSGIAGLREWWNADESVTTQDGQAHHITFTGSGANARLVMRSTPQPYITYLNQMKTAHHLTDDQINPAINKAEEIDREKQKTVPDDQKEAHGQNIHNLVRQLAGITRALPLSGAGTTTPAVYGPLINGYGSSVTVNRLTHDHPSGSEPGVSSPQWEALVRRKEGGRTLFIRGHLLNNGLGGPGDSWSNLTPLTQRANNAGSASHYHGFEKHVKKAVDEDNKQVNFTVTVRYGRSFNSALHQYFANQGNVDDALRADIVEAEQDVPLALQCESQEVNADGSSGALVKQHTVDNAFTQTKDDYPLTAVSAPRVTVYLNSMSKSELMSLNGIGEALADGIINNRPFRTKVEIQSKVHIAEGRWNQMQSTPGKLVRIYST